MSLHNYVRFSPHCPEMLRPCEVPEKVDIQAQVKHTPTTSAEEQRGHLSHLCYLRNLVVRGHVDHLRPSLRLLSALVGGHGRPEDWGAGHLLPPRLPLGHGLHLEGLG